MIFNLFKKNYPVPVKKTSVGSHGDHMRLAFGSNAHEIVLPTIQETLKKEPKETIGRVSYYSVGDATISLPMIVKGNTFVTAFPWLHDESTIYSFSTKEVIERSHVGGLEAWVSGRVKETFSITYFAIDYWKNREHYLNNTEHKIHLSAFAYSLQEVKDFGKSLAMEVHENFAGFMPNVNSSHKDDYSFVGEILSFEEVSNQVWNGYVMKIKLINLTEEPDCFNVSMFVNKEYCHISHMSIGMRVGGDMRLQGMIAN